MLDDALWYNSRWRILLDLHGSACSWWQQSFRPSSFSRHFYTYAESHAQCLLSPGTFLSGCELDTVPPRPLQISARALLTHRHRWWRRLLQDKSCWSAESCWEERIVVPGHLAWCLGRATSLTLRLAFSCCKWIHCQDSFLDIEGKKKVIKSSLRIANQ